MTSQHMPRILGGALSAILAGALALPASADTVPTYATGSTDETIRGTVATVHSPTSIAVRDARGFVDNVTLHRGTIINPTGLTLEPGQSVTIVGHAENHAFSANEIDTPYQAVAVGSYDRGYDDFGFGYNSWYGRGAFYGGGIGFGRGFGFRRGI